MSDDKCKICGIIKSKSAYIIDTLGWVCKKCYCDVPDKDLLLDHHLIQKLISRIERLEEVWGQVLDPKSYVQLKARIEKLEQNEL